MKDKKNTIIATLLIIATLATSGAAVAAPHRRPGHHRHGPHPIEWRRPPHHRPHHPPHMRPRPPMLPQPYYNNRENISYDTSEGVTTSNMGAGDVFKQALANSAGEIIGQAAGNIAGEILSGIFGR